MSARVNTSFGLVAENGLKTRFSSGFPRPSLMDFHRIILRELDNLIIKIIRLKF